MLYNRTLTKICGRGGVGLKRPPPNLLTRNCHQNKKRRNFGRSTRGTPQMQWVPSTWQLWGGVRCNKFNSATRRGNHLRSHEEMFFMWSVGCTCRTFFLMVHDWENRIDGWKRRREHNKNSVWLGLKKEKEHWLVAMFWGWKENIYPAGRIVYGKRTLASAWGW